MRPRDPGLERYLTDLAARSAGLTHDGGLGAYADSRALPGPVRSPLDAVQETREELADSRNYCVWGIEPVYAQVLAGDLDALAHYDRLLRTLAGVNTAWAALHS